MAKRKTSIALTPREIERFKEAADARKLSLSEFMSKSAANVLDATDGTQALKEFAADLRADLSKVMARLTETDALQAQERARFLDEQRNVLGNFLQDLKEAQRQAVKEAFLFGQTKPTKPTPQDLGLRPSPPLKGNS